LAFIIDHIIITIIVVMPASRLESLFEGAQFFVILAVAFILCAIKDIVKGQSPGKFILGIAVRNQNDTSEMPSVAKLFLRNIFCFLWPIDFLILVFSKTKIGDKITGTDVYRLSKKPSIFIRLAIVFAIPILLVLFMLFSSGSRVPLTAEEFTLHMEEAGFVVEDMAYRLEEDSIMESALLVSTEYFRIEFAVFYSDAHARMAHNANRRALDAVRQGGMASTTEVSMPRFSRFTQTFGGQYVVISRIENTFVFAITDSVNRADLNEVLRMIGY
jgi:hypothetical protein